MELLITVVILGILASVGLANYSKTMQKAQDKEAETYVQLLAQAAETYRQEKNFFPVSIGDLNPAPNLPAKGNTTSRWAYGYIANAATPPPSVVWPEPVALLKNPGGAGYTGRYLKILRVVNGSAVTYPPEIHDTGADPTWLNDEP